VLDYTKIDLDTQLAHITSELPSVDLLTQKATMWAQAGSELSTASQSFASANRTLAPDWTDELGQRWLEDAEASQQTLTTWEQNVNGNNPSADLQAVAAAIPPTHETVLKFKQIADSLKALASNPVMGAAVQQIILALQQAAGALMNKLAGDYASAGDKVAAAGAGGAWVGLQGGSPGSANRSADDSEDGRSTSSGAGSDSGSLAGFGGLGDLGGQGGAAGHVSTPDHGTGSDVDSEVDSLSPELSGGGGLAPPSAPPLSPPPAMSPVPPPVGAATGMPVAPMMGALGGVGGRSGGGVRMPSVAVPRPTHIPVAAAPVNPLTAPAPAAAPAVPQPLVSPPAAVAGTVGAGAVPPLMPMMGGAGLGAGGSTAGVGSGLARRPVRRPEDEDTPTPGLPAMLSGKAGVADPFAFAVQRSSAAPDAPSTVEFIDEDVWQAGRRAPARAGAEQEVR
jgi:hypothetical protein